MEILIWDFGQSNANIFSPSKQRIAWFEWNITHSFRNETTILSAKVLFAYNNSVRRQFCIVSSYQLVWALHSSGLAHAKWTQSNSTSTKLTDQLKITSQPHSNGRECSELHNVSLLFAAPDNFVRILIRNRWSTAINGRIRHVVWLYSIGVLYARSCDRVCVRCNFNRSLRTKNDFVCSRKICQVGHIACWFHN